MTENCRRVTVFTGTRAEYGLMRRMISLLSREVDLSLLVSGAHLSSIYGETVKEIESDGFAPVILADIALTDNSPVGIGHSMGLALDEYVKAFASLRPALLVVLGDRYESFCAVAAASILRVPVAHLGGGEVSQGAVDELFRHAMTKMSHLHFVSNDLHRRRVIQMGENPEHVWNTGPLGVENIRSLPVMTENEVRADLNLPAGVPYLLLTYHPVTLDKDEAGEVQIRILLEALTELKGLISVFTAANADAGGEKINRVLSERAGRDDRFRFFKSLGVKRYINAARYAAGVAGNSSSGMVEIPSLGVPVLDIGDRQKGRDRLPSVIHCPASAEGLAEGLQRLLAPEARGAAETAKDHYSRLDTSRALADIIGTYPLEEILFKKFRDLPGLTASSETTA